MNDAALHHCAVLGLQYSFGIFFVEIVNEFNANEGSAAWVPALAMVRGYCQDLPDRSASSNAYSTRMFNKPGTF